MLMARKVKRFSGSPVDQSLAVVTAILRLAEIQQSQRWTGFSEVAFADLVREKREMYGHGGRSD